MAELYIAAWGQDIEGKGQDPSRPAKTVKFLVAQKKLLPGTTVKVMSDYQLDSDPVFETKSVAPTARRLDGGIGYKRTCFAGLVTGGTANAPIRFRPWGAPTRTIDGGANVALAFQLEGAAAHIDIQGFVFKNSGISINPYSAGGTCHHILIRNCVFTSICDTAKLAFDMAPGTGWKSHGAIFTNNMTHHVTIDKCRFIDIGPTKALAASQWHYASAIYRDEAGRIYHHLENKTGGIDLMRAETWGAFKYPDEGALLASATIGGAPNYKDKAKLIADTGLTTDKALIDNLWTSPTHWFQHSHSIYAQGWEITVSNCYFSHNSMGWQLKIDSNIGVGVKALDQAKLVSQGGIAYFDPLPDNKSKLKQYALQDSTAAPWYNSNDFPALGDGIVRTHRVLGNCFDGRNQWINMAALPPVGDVLPTNAPTEEWTSKGLVHDIMAGSQPKPMYTYSVDNRKSNVIIHVNDELTVYAIVDTGQLCSNNKAATGCLPVFNWSPKNVQFVNNDFNPPAPAAAKPASYPIPGAAIMLNTWGWWSGGVLDPAGCKLVPLGADGALTSPKFLLAVKGTEFVANRVYPWPGGDGFGSFFYFPNTRWLACDPKTEKLGWYMKQTSDPAKPAKELPFVFYTCLDDAKAGYKPDSDYWAYWQPGIPGPLQLTAPAGMYPGAPAFVTIKNDERFYVDTQFISMGSAPLVYYPFIPSPLDPGCSTAGCLGQKLPYFPYAYTLAESKTIPFVAVFQGTKFGPFAGTGFLLPNINAQLAVAAVNGWVAP